MNGENLITVEEAERRDRSPRCLTLDQWADRDVPLRDFLLGTVFTTTTRAILSADTGLGKTHLGFAFGFGMASGKGFCHWRGHRPTSVLLVDGEMSVELVRARLADAEKRISCRPETLFALCREDVPDMPPLDTPEGQEWLNGLIRDLEIEFVILDNVMSLTAGDMSDPEAWKPVNDWMRTLTALRIGCLWIHHTGHDARRGFGTKTREWQLDTVMVGEKIEEATDADIAIRLTFTKARQRTPDTRDDFEPCELRLIGDEWKSTAATRRRSMPRNTNVAMQTLREAIEATGQTVPSMTGVPNGVQGVQIAQWRDHFYRRRPLGVDDDGDADELRRAKEARKKDFKRCREALQEVETIQCVTDWYWITK